MCNEYGTSTRTISGPYSYTIVLTIGTSVGKQVLRIAQTWCHISVLEYVQQAGDA
jgi:hypothetical protein